MAKKRQQGKTKLELMEQSRIKLIEEIERLEQLVISLKAENLKHLEDKVLLQDKILQYDIFFHTQSTEKAKKLLVW